MAPPLIYLPGLDGTGRLLHRQPRLHAEYQVRCLAYAQDRVQTYEELADLGAAALQEMGPGVVLAESFGGAVALTLALRRPELVQRLVLVNTFAYFPRQAMIHLAAWLGRYFPAKPSHPASRGPRGLFFFAPDIPARERDDWWNRTGDVPMSAFGGRLLMIANLDLRPSLPTIDIPTLVSAAPNDRVVPPDGGKLLAHLLPHAHLLQPRSGHAALIHPTVDIAAWLATPSYWPAAKAAPMATKSPGDRPG